MTATWWSEPCLWDDEPTENPWTDVEPEPQHERPVEDVPVGEWL